jgi:hypothetical protein
MSWFTKLTDWMGWETVRARDEKGRYIADDKSTPNVDESKKRVYKKKGPSKARTNAKAAKKPVAKKKPATKKRAYKPKTNGE